MTNPRNPGRFAAELLRHDEPLSDTAYEEYRRRLENALTTAERREKWAGRVVVISCVVSFTLMFVGGTNLLGDFDPWSKDANMVSVTAGVIHALATGIFFVSLASYYSRFRPGVREARERLRDATILDLQRQLRELRTQLMSPPPHDPPSEEKT